MARGSAYDPALVLTVSGLTIGRAANSALRLDDSYASPYHARLDWANGQWVIVDLRSQNGVYVNGRRVTSQVLRPGDQVQIGQSLLVFQAG